MITLDTVLTATLARSATLRMVGFTRPDDPERRRERLLADEGTDGSGGTLSDLGGSVTALPTTTLRPPDNQTPSGQLRFDLAIRLTARVLQTFEIEPRAAQRGTVIWMHGLGASCHDFDDVVPLLKAPHLRFVFPSAPVRPVTINGGMPMPAWYDLISLQEPPFRENEAHVRQAESDIAQLIERECARGVAARDITLMGFSQGGAMALHAGLRYPEPLCSIVVLSGYLVLPQCFEAERVEAQHQTPLFFGHGSEDPVVPLSLGASASSLTRDAGYSVQTHQYPMGHSLCLEEIDDLRRWLSTHYSRGPESRDEEVVSF